MDPGNYQINTRSWETLVLIKFKLGILTTVDTVTKKEINIPGSNIIIILLTVQLMISSCKKIIK